MPTNGSETRVPQPCAECTRLGEILDAVDLELQDAIYDFEDFDTINTETFRDTIDAIRAIIQQGTADQIVERFLAEQPLTPGPQTLAAIRAQRDELKKLREQLAEREAHV